MRRIVALSSIGLACLTFACATLGRGNFKEPIVTLKDARITGVGLSGGALEVVLNVYNPNNFTLDGVRLTYNVLVDSIPFGNGTHDNKFTVTKKDTTELTLPMQFTYAGIGAAGRQLMQTGSVQYRVKGDITVSSVLGDYTRPYDQVGRFSTLSGTRR